MLVSVFIPVGIPRDNGYLDRAEEGAAAVGWAGVGILRLGRARRLLQGGEVELLRERQLVEQRCASWRTARVTTRHVSK